MSIIEALRAEYIQAICTDIITTKQPTERQKQAGQTLDYPSFADGSSRSCVTISRQLAEYIHYDQTLGPKTLQSQTAGSRFEEATCGFIEKTFEALSNLRPGEWIFQTNKTNIDRFEQYRHLAELTVLLNEYSQLKAALGSDGDYIVGPDIVISRIPVSDDEINRDRPVIDEESNVARKTPLRLSNQDADIYEMMHASISCKWTMRSDRNQNTRTEALNLIRNRKGHLPHIVVVTAEPLPTRIASIALGTGDLDCVYHFALTELRQAVNLVGSEDQQEILETMILGRRLRDIADLPFDLAI